MAGQDPNEPVTREMLDEAVSAILEGVSNMFGERDKRFDKVDRRLDKVEEEIQGVKVGLSQVRDEINGLKADLSDTPSRREFEELKDKIEDHIQLPH